MHFTLTQRDELFSFPTVSIKRKAKKKYHTVGTCPKLNRKFTKRGKIDTLEHIIHDHSFSWQV